jgi:hypothetical protein
LWVFRTISEDSILEFRRGFNSRIGKVYNDDLSFFFFLPTGNIIMAIKSRGMRWMRYVVHMKDMKMHTKYLSENG